MRPSRTPSASRPVVPAIALVLAWWLASMARAEDAPRVGSDSTAAGKAPAAESAGAAARPAPGDTSGMPPLTPAPVLVPAFGDSGARPESLGVAPTPADTAHIIPRFVSPFDTTGQSGPIDRSAWVSWTPRISRLALPRWQLADGIFAERESWRLKYPVDARTVKVSVDPEKGTVSTTLAAADVPLTEPREVPMEDFARELTALNLRRTWVSESRNRINRVPTEAQQQASKSALNFRLPVEMPKAVSGILGAGGPSLNVSGSERISIAGTSQWDNRATSTGAKRSVFPQLDMRQDLDIRLDGSLGDKLHVDVAQNSANTLPLANRIGIRYVGYDDEIVKNLDLGNTNLSLPGTQYVSYSGRNEGLFGAKAAARVGGTDLALIASKQEGRSERKSFQGTAQEVERQIDDLNYIKGKYFFLQRPSEQLATDSRIEIGTLRVFVDDRDGTNDQGVRTGTAEIDPTQPAGTSPSLRGSFDGRVELTDYEVSFTYYGDRFPVLVLKSALSNSQILAVAYDEKLPDGSTRHVGSVPDCPTDPTQPCPEVRLKVLQAPRDELKAKAEATDFFETDSTKAPFIVTRDYEIKSFYDLQTSNIDPKSIVLQVRRYDPNVIEGTDSYKEGASVFSYLRMLGVDLFKDNGSGSPLEGQDQTVDQFTNAYFLDTERGVIFFPDLRPFDPRVGPRPDANAVEEYFYKSRVQTDNSIPGARGRILWPNGMANAPGVEVGGGVTPYELESNPNVYDKRNVLLTADRHYYIYAKFAGQDYSGNIFLGQTNLLEGSEVVAIEGVPLERNKDYTIDYEAGTVTLLTQRARENRSRLTIDYSFAPLFAQAGRTLVGSTAGYRGVNNSFGGAFIYESKGQQEARPRIGEEPTKTLIGDAYAQFSLKPQWLTGLADKLPFYSTTEESRIDLNGEIGVSMPNPNTKNTIYLDDFEGNRDSYSAPISRGFWKWASQPLVRAPGGVTDTVKADMAELIWYNPYNTVKGGDLNPRLTRNEGAENIVNVLDFYIPKAPAVREFPTSLWAGATTTVEPDGADFSRMQYLEVWVNDWRDPDVRANPDIKLHIDLGIVSEDQQRAPNAPPNGLFDTEDKNHDGKYDPRGSDPNLFEDGGGDGTPDELETDIYDLSTADSTRDKHGDDRGDAVNDQGEPVTISSNQNGVTRYDPFVYIKPNLSENNKGTVDNGSRLFTEDLNNNGILDVTNDYVTYTLPLGDEEALSRFLIFAAESTLTVEGNPVAPNNGWKRYRIPLDEADPRFRQVIGSGTLSNVKHMRIWLEGVQTFKGNDTPVKTDPTGSGRQPIVEIAAVDVVGNRWRLASQDSATVMANGSIVARNVNNQEDRNVYDPPFAVEQQSSGGSSTTQREQSLALEVTRLPVGSTGSVFKTETLAEDYTRYGSLGFYTAQFGFTNEDSARYFVRMGYDDRNYYEYSRPIRDAAPAPYRPTPWQAVTIRMTDFTDLKFDRGNAVADTAFRGDERFVVVGSPTFTRIQQFTVGVVSDKALVDSSLAGRIQNTMSGTIWIDDLRAIDVDRSTGLANRFTMFTKVADLMTLTGNWDKTDENFQRLGQSRGSDVNQQRLSLSGGIDPSRFFRATGVAMPVQFNWARQTSTPRLVTGTDIILQSADARAQQTDATDRGFSVALSKTGDRNPIMRNTIGRVQLNFAFSDRVGHSPTTIDSSRTLAGGGSYSVAPSEWFKLNLPLLRTRTGPVKLQLLPVSAQISYSQQTQRSFLYKRGLDDPTGLYALQNDVYRKSSVYLLSASWRPLPLGSYTVNATRNAYLPGVEPAHILGINFGRMTNFQQRIDGRFGVKQIPFLNPNFDFATSYTEGRTPDLSPDLQLGQFQNSTNAGLTMELPFARLASKPAPKPTPPPQPRAPHDSTGRDTTFVPPVPPSSGGISIPVGRTLARIGNVSMRGTFTRTTGFSRYYGVPSVPYRLGLVRDPNTQWNGDTLLSIYRGPQATDNAQRTWSGDASTQILLVGRSSVRVRVNYTNQNRGFNSQVSNSQNVTLPDLDFDWGSVQRLLGLGGVFQQLGARTHYTKVDTREGFSLRTPTAITEATNFTPLLSLQGTTKGQAQILLSFESSSSKRDDLSTRRASRKEGTTTVRTSVSRTYLPGQKLPLFGGKGLKSSLTLQADGTYSKRTGSTEAFGATSSKTNTDNIAINTSGTYAFSTYVNGTIGLGFTQSRDLQQRSITGNPITQRSLRLEGAATFRF